MGNSGISPDHDSVLFLATLQGRSWCMKAPKLPKTESAPLLVDADTLAARYGIASKTVRKWGADGTLPFIKISRRCVRYPVADCDLIMTARRVNAICES